MGIIKDYSAKKELQIDSETGLMIEVRVTDILIEPEKQEITLTFKECLIAPTGIVVKVLNTVYAKRYNGTTVKRFDALQASPIGLGIEQMLQPDLNNYPNIQQIQ